MGERASPDEPAAPVPLATLVVYALPAAGLGYTYFLCTIYLLKFATDVLLVAPGVMGLLFGLSRVWDALSDPLAGYLSDRTRSRLGRRRSWLLASAVPIAGGTLMLWSPPHTLEGAALALWMGTGVFVYFTAVTVFSVPHEALGAELSANHHERTRVFGWKQGIYLIGTFVAVGVFYLLLGSDEPRRVASRQAFVVVGVTTALIALAVARLRERPDYQGRGGVAPLRALRDVLTNPHARLLLAVFLIENFGTAVLGVLTPFAMQYVFGIEEQTAFFILSYFVPALLFIPVWVRLSRSYGKRNLWIFSMSMLAVAFGGLAFVPPETPELIYGLGVIAGIGGGCGQVVGPSIQADVIDYDEYRTGERKEGVYFAAWNFVKKGAYGIAVMLTGLMLAAVGYEPNVEQGDAAKLGIRALFGLVPGGAFVIGTLLFLRFRLDEAEHTRVQLALDARRRAQAAGTE